MKEFDHNGLLLAEYQGKLFEQSANLDCSTPIFIRRFLHSELLTTLDKNIPILLSLDVNEGLSSINEEYGASSYGKEKYSESSLFWIGFMYRYISYTREQPTSFVMNLFNYKLMNEVYYTFHTQENELVIKNLLEIVNLDESIFNNNERLKKIIQSKPNYLSNI